MITAVGHLDGFPPIRFLCACVPLLVNLLCQVWFPTGIIPAISVTLTPHPANGHSVGVVTTWPESHLSRCAVTLVSAFAVYTDIALAYDLNIE